MIPKQELTIRIEKSNSDNFFGWIRFGRKTHLFYATDYVQALNEARLIFLDWIGVTPDGEHLSII